MEPSTLVVVPHLVRKLGQTSIEHWNIKIDGADYAPLLTRFNLHITAGCLATAWMAYRDSVPERPRMVVCAPAEITLGDHQLSVARVAGTAGEYALTAHAGGSELLIESASVSISAFSGPSITYTYA